MVVNIRLELPKPEYRVAGIGRGKEQHHTTVQGKELVAGRMVPVSNCYLGRAKRCRVTPCRLVSHEPIIDKREVGLNFEKAFQSPSEKQRTLDSDSLW